MLAHTFDPSTLDEIQVSLVYTGQPERHSGTVFKNKSKQVHSESLDHLEVSKCFHQHQTRSSYQERVSAHLNCVCFC